LSKAFSGLAIIGLIELIAQLPAVIDKASEALTGWNETAKKAYADQLQLNAKYVDTLKQTTAELDKMADAQVRTAAAAANQQKFTGPLAGVLNRIVPLGNLDPIAEQRKADAIQQERVARHRQEAQQVAEDADKAIDKTIKDLNEMIEAANKARLATEAMWRSIRGFVPDQRLPLPGGPGGLRGTFGQTLFSLPDVTQDFPTAGIDFGAAATAAQAATDRAREFANRQAEIRADAELEASKMVFDKQREQAMHLAQVLNDSLGAAWDNMFIRGRSVLAGLANFAAGIGNAIGRTFFQAAGNRILGGSLGLASRIPGIGRALGGLGLGGLSAGFAGASALGSTAVAGLASTAPLAFGLSASAAPMAIGGIGVGGAAAGGASFLGMGLTTAIPVVGGIVGAALLAFHFLRRRTQEAPFSQDPNAIERNRTYFFHTATEVNERLIRLLEGVSTMPPGLMVSEGLPLALNSSNTFRRDMASVLMDDT
jgi:hypothetical protein